MSDQTNREVVIKLTEEQREQIRRETGVVVEELKLDAAEAQRGSKYPADQDEDKSIRAF